MQVNRFDKTVLDSRPMKLLPIAAVLASMVTGPQSSEAESCEAVAGYTCEYEMVEESLQKVPPYFKFQTRISQAKLPVGDVIFDKIYVNVKSGEAALCQESFSQVPVRDSVLNLEIGRTMNCDLGTIISKNQNLKFQICIGNQENCLKPVALSSVPYAIKSSYAFMAQKAHTANESVQCHYAHRMTADQAMFENKQIGIGFYDFHTPDIGYIDTLIDMYGDTAMSTPAPYYNGGFIQWAQIDPSSNNLHICAHYPESTGGELGRLEELVFHAAKTQSFGQLVALGNPTYERGADMTNPVNQPTPDRSLVAARGMTTRGVGYFNDDVVYRNQTDGADGSAGSRKIKYYETHTLEGHGVSNFYNAVNVGQSVLGEGDEEFEEYLALDSGEGAEHVMNVNHWMNVNGVSQFNANAVFKENALFNGPGKAVAVGGQTSLVADGPAQLSGPVEIGSTPGGGAMNVYHDTVFYGNVTIDDVEGGISVPSGSIGNDELTDSEVLDVLGLIANKNKTIGVGIQASGSTTALNATGGTTGVDATGDEYGVEGFSSAGVGVHGKTLSGKAAVLGTTSGNTVAPDLSKLEGYRAGIVGYSTSVGVYGESYSSGINGYGVWGVAENHAGVRGESTSWRGIEGVSFSDEAAGVYGTSSFIGVNGIATLGGTGVHGESDTGIGVFGLSRITTGANGVGGYFHSGSDPIGVSSPWDNSAVYATSSVGPAGYFRGATRGIVVDSYNDAGRFESDSGNGVVGIGSIGGDFLGGRAGVSAHSVSNIGGFFLSGVLHSLPPDDIKAGVYGVALDGPGGYFRGGTHDNYHAPINIGIRREGSSHGNPEPYYGDSDGDFWIKESASDVAAAYSLCWRIDDFRYCLDLGYTGDLRGSITPVPSTYP